MNERLFNRQVDRNLKGNALEKSGKIDKAIQLYEANIAEDFEGNFPYDRLAIIYKKRNWIDDEIRVLKRGIEVFSKLNRMDVPSKLTKFKERLAKRESEN